MVISVSGYGSTGASAYVDFLNEFDELQGLPDAVEFQILQQPAGILDLYDSIYSGNRIKNSVAIKRFINNYENLRNNRLDNMTSGRLKKLSEEYIKSLKLVEWDGSSNYDPMDIKTHLEKKEYNIIRKAVILVHMIFGKKWMPKQHRYYATVSKKEFCEVTKGYINEILNCCGIDKSKPVILEQVFSCDNPLHGMEFFDNPISIIVDRDPRDVYLLTNVIFPELNGYMPNSGNVEAFVSYYKALHKERIIDHRIKYVNYEDLIYRYESISKKFEEWTGKVHLKKRLFFKPEYSINNTQLFKKYPYYRKEIDYIEKELKEMLYDFTSAEKNLSFEVVECKPFEHQSDVH